MPLERGYRLKGPMGGNLGEIPRDRPFKYKGVDYPSDWVKRGGSLPGVATIEPFDNRPPPPGPPSVWMVPLQVVFDRLTVPQKTNLADAIDTLAPVTKWGYIVGQKVASDDAPFRTLISNLPGSPDPDVILGR